MIELTGDTDYISIPKEDFEEYQHLIKGRQVITDLIERDGTISMLTLLSCLGGAKASRLYADIRKEYK